MGLNLGFIGKKLHDIFGAVGNDILNPGQAVQQGVNFIAHTPQVRQAVQQVQHTIQPTIQQIQQQTPQIGGFAINNVIKPAINSTPLGQGAQAVSHIAPVIGGALQHGAAGLTNATAHIPVVAPVVKNFVAPQISQVGTTVQHEGNIASGRLPAAYTHGSLEQRAGAVGQDVLNVASVLPIGVAAKGAQIGLKGGSKLLPQIAKSAATNAAFGAGYNATGAMSQNASLPDVLKSGAVGGLAGGTIGAAVPLVGAGVGKVVGRAKGPQVSLKETPSPVEQAGASQTKPAQITPQTGQVPKVQLQPPKITPSKSLSLSEPSTKVAQVQPPNPQAVKDYAKSFNVSEKQAAKELATPPVEGVTMANLEKGIKNTRNLVNSQEVSPGLREPTQYAIDRELSAQRNPVKVSIPEVNPEDYGKARSNAQLASAPIGTATDHAVMGVKRLHPDDQARFWKDFVENPASIKTAKNPAKVQEAVNRWRSLADQVHATDRALGGNTGYIENYARGHNYDLSNEADAAKYTQKLQQDGYSVSPEDFKGINNLPRAFKTIREAEGAGFKVKPSDPAKEIQDFGGGAAFKLRQQAIERGLKQADAAEVAKNGLAKESLDLGHQKLLGLSEKGLKEAKTFKTYTPSSNKVVKGIRSLNVGLKSSILSLGQFHTINVGALRAAPTLIMNGHPGAAATGLYRMLRGAFGRKYADNVIGAALKDGTVEKAARIGMPYGGSGYNVEGTFLKHGIGSRTVFGKQIPMMHDQVARSIIKDLEGRGVSLDSPEARQAGLAGANLMGELNHTVENISPKTRQAMTDWMLAGQFTPSKFKQMGTALNPKAYTRGAVAGQYAATNVAANVAAVTAVIGGLGYINKQKSDNVRDMLLRALVDPAVPTPFKDNKGNTQRLKLPGTDASDVARLVGIKLVRQSDGHLGVDWHLTNMPSTVEDFLRARLSPLSSAVVKVATNENFANKPLSDPNAPFGKRAVQAATTLGVGMLPIGLQGVAYTDWVKNHVPGDAKDVLDANTPGSNPVVKSIGSSFGLTPSTDQTVGKALETSRYFSALDAAKRGLNRQQQDAIDLYSGSKKNPVTGKYDVMPNANDQRAKATTLLQNPEVINRLVAMNQKLKSEGQKVDPLWQQPTDRVTKVLQYQAMPPDGPDAKDWRNKNPWYSQVQKERSGFFASLPKGDPNKPKTPIEYPVANSDVQGKMDNYFKITDSQKKAQFIKSHPELQDQLDKQADYYNQLRTAQGYAPFKGYPKAPPALQKYLDSYMGADKATRKGLRNGSPGLYQQMAAYFDKVDLYNIDSQASVSALQGEPDYTSKELKSMSGLSRDIYQGADGQYSVQPAGWMKGLTNGYSKTYIKRAKTHHSYVKGRSLSFSAGGGKPKPAVSFKTAAALKSSKGMTGAKVSLKRSPV